MVKWKQRVGPPPPQAPAHFQRTFKHRHQEMEGGAVNVTTGSRANAPSEESMIVLILILFVILMMGTVHGMVLRVRGEI